MSNSNVSPLWTLNTTFDSAHIFNGSILYHNFSGSAVNGSYNSSELWTAFSDSFNATSWTNGYPTYILFQGACLNGSDEVNCVAACSHSDILFSSIQTLYNCFLAPYVSSLIFLLPHASQSSPAAGRCGSAASRPGGTRGQCLFSSPAGPWAELYRFGSCQYYHWMLC